MLNMLVGDSFGLGDGSLVGVVVLVSLVAYLAVVRWLAVVAARILALQDRDVKRITVKQCSACMNRHEGIPVSPVRAETIDGLVFTHVGVCPDTGIKLFVRFDEE